MAYLVRSFRTYARIRSLTTGTFNRIFKDRITFRLSGAYSVQPDPHLVRIRPSSKPFNNTVCATTSQRNPCTAFPPVFHKGWFCVGTAASAVQSSASSTRQGWIQTQPWKSGPSGPRQDSIEREGFSPCGRAQRYSLPPGKDAFSARKPKRKTEN